MLSLGPRLVRTQRSSGAWGGTGSDRGLGWTSPQAASEGPVCFFKTLGNRSRRIRNTTAGRQDSAHGRPRTLHGEADGTNDTFLSHCSH